MQHISLIYICGAKVEVMIMSPRTGRPTDNPKSGSVNIRLDAECEKVLTEYCEQEKVTKAEAVRTGIKMLECKIKK